MTRFKLALCLCATAVLFATPVRAQGIRLFVTGSGSFLKNERFFTSLGDRFRTNYANGGKITLGGEITPWKIVGLEGAYSYGANNLRLSDLSEAASPTTGYGVRFQRLSADLVGHSPVSILGLRPYAVAGVEFARLAPTDQAKTTAFTVGFAGQPVVLSPSNKVGVNFGGGLEWTLLPLVGLRADVRDHITGSPTYGLSSRTFPISGVAHDVELSAGVVFHLGK